MSELHEYPDAMHDIACKRRFVGMIVRGFFDPVTVDAVVSQLKEGGPMGELFISPHRVIKDLPYRPPGFFGRALLGSPDMSQYFATAAAFREQCKVVFGRPHFEERLQSVFEQLAGGRRIAVPTNAEGQIYAPATIRILPPGHEIKLHVGNDFLRTKAAEYLSTFMDTKADQLSFFMPLSVSTTGGELIVYTRKWSEDEPADTQLYMRHDEAVEGCPSLSLVPGPGDLLMFNGGRFFHRVSMVEGEGERWTIGGFMALSRDQSQFYYWS
jgi:hypothetical protein